MVEQTTSSTVTLAKGLATGKVLQFMTGVMYGETVTIVRHPLDTVKT